MMDPSPTSRFISSNIETGSNLEHVVSVTFNTKTRLSPKQVGIGLLSLTIDDKCICKKISSQCCICIEDASSARYKSMQCRHLQIYKSRSSSATSSLLSIFHATTLKLMKLLVVLDSAPEHIWQLILLF